MSCPCADRNNPDAQPPPPPTQQDGDKGHVCTCALSKRTADGIVRCRNPNLQDLPSDILHHLNLGTETHNLHQLFGDVKFVVMGGDPNRMKNFAHYMKGELKVSLPCGVSLTDISKHSYRYALYKTGPILSVSHGMGCSSISILLHEVIKLMHYAKCKNPIFFRIGTCGGLDVDPGTVIITESLMDAMNRDYHEVCVLGYPVRRPIKLDTKITNRLKKFASPDDGYQTISGKTLCTMDFYEEQARCDGAICEHGEAEKMEYLTRLKGMGVINIEMEGIPFASYTNHCGIQAAMICVCTVDRMKGDQIPPAGDDYEKIQMRPMILVGRYITKYFEKLLEKRRREMSMLI